jgi:integrase
MGRRSEHVYGPYKHGERWRLVLATGDGGRSVESFASEGECVEAIAAYRARIAGLQVSEAIVEFLDATRARGLAEGSVVTTGYRLRAVLQVDTRKGTTGGLVADLTPVRARRLLAGYKAAVDTRKGSLASCRAFGAFCVERGYLRTDPFAGCKVEGRKRRGKVQLSIDEGRVFFARALELANGGDVAALGVLLCLTFGCRASEIADRVVRDLDDRGRVLSIPHGKTASARRRLAVPPVLQPAINRAIAPDGRRRRPTDPLLPRDGLPPTRHWLRYHVRRICRMAGVTDVCTHSLRGLAATAATVAQEGAAAVAGLLGHASPTVTERHYLAPGTAAAARAARSFGVLAGGRA